MFFPFFNDVENKIDRNSGKTEDEPEGLSLSFYGKSQEQTEIGEKKEQNWEADSYPGPLPFFASSSLKNFL